MAQRTKPKAKGVRSSGSQHKQAAGRTAAKLKAAGQAPLTARETGALNAKIAIRSAVKVSPSQLGLQPQASTKAFLGQRSMKEFPLGRFEGLENIRLRWVRPDWFEFIPRATTPFAFIRANGTRIEPRRMFTDGGSIPRIARLGEGLDPWGYAPAFLCHDREFDVHHCGRSNKTFEEVRDMMMEAVRTLMNLGLGSASALVFQLIYAGIDSGVARDLWKTRVDRCPLPPDAAE